MRERRVALGLSQEELAGSTLTGAYVSLIETGKRNPTASTIAYLAEVLGCSPRFLTDGVDEAVQREIVLARQHAELALATGKTDEAEHAFSSMLRDADSDTDRRLAEWGLARALETRGRHEQAIAAYERLRTAMSPENDPDLTVSLVIALSRCYRHVGDYGHSIELAERALGRISALGLSGTDLEVQLATTLAAAYAARGDLMRASVIARQAIDRAERAGSPRSRGEAYWSASVLAHDAGRTDEAILLAERAVALFGELDDEINLARLRTTYATLLLRDATPQVDEALGLLETAKGVLIEADRPAELARCETEIARALILGKRAVEAVDAARAAIDRLGADARLERVAAQLVLHEALTESGAGNEAAALLPEVIGDLTALDGERRVAQAWRDLGDVAMRSEDVELAVDAYARSLTVAGIPRTTSIGSD